jgi:hypothetical protein
MAVTASLALCVRQNENLFSKMLKWPHTADQGVDRFAAIGFTLQRDASTRRPDTEGRRRKERPKLLYTQGTISGKRRTT